VPSPFRFFKLQEIVMEVIQLLVASKYGFAALASVSIAVLMLASTLGGLAYMAGKPSRDTSRLAA
jgi:hypothetical protein